MSVDRSAESGAPAESAMVRANRTLRMVIACHEAVARAVTEQELLDSICEVLVDHDNYELVWIGRPMHDAHKTVAPVANKGFTNEYLESLTVRWGDDEFGNGPTGRAIKTAKSSVNQRIRDHPKFEPWRERATKFGYESSAAIPCCVPGTAPSFVMNVYSAQPEAFDDEEVSLLEALAADLAFGASHLTMTAVHLEAELKLRSALIDTVHAVASALEKRDAYTTGHQERVAALATEIAKTMGWDDDRVTGLRLGSTIHDIGKISVPISILNRPGRLTRIEFEMIKAHPISGWEILSKINFPWPIKEIVLQHHERTDGSGYPNGLMGDETKTEAKIVAVADVVEAMSSNRPYRPGLGVGAALEEIEQGRGIIYDPHVVDACLEVFRQQNFEWDPDTSQAYTDVQT